MDEWNARRFDVVVVLTSVAVERAALELLLHLLAARHRHLPSLILYVKVLSLSFLINRNISLAV